MIININQTQADRDQLFDVFYDNMPKYRGKLGRFSPLETFSLRSKIQKLNLTGAYALPSPLDMVPFTYIFGRPKIIRNCYCQINMRRLGTIGCVEEGIAKIHHHITDSSGTKFDAYHFAEYNGSEYICIYLEDDLQVAMIESSLTVENSCKRYTLYILDEYKDRADIFSMFVMYFDNWYNATRFRAKNGTTTAQKKPTKVYTDKFDPNWHVVNFRDEVFNDSDAR